MTWGYKKKKKKKDKLGDQNGLLVGGLNIQLSLN